MLFDYDATGNMCAGTCCLIAADAADVSRSTQCAISATDNTNETTM